MEYIPNLAIKLKVLRMLRGMPQKKLCEKTGISRPLLVDIEQGRALPVPEQLQKLEIALGIKFNADTETAFATLAPELGQGGAT